MRVDLNGGESEARGVVARFFTALRFVLNDDEGGFEDTSSTASGPPSPQGEGKVGVEM